MFVVSTHMVILLNSWLSCYPYIQRLTPLLSGGSVYYGVFHCLGLFLMWSKSPNTCCLYLKATTMASLVSGDWDLVTYNYLCICGDSNIIYSLTWPQKGRTSSHAWTTWWSKYMPLILEKWLPSTLWVHGFHNNDINPGDIITILFRILFTEKYHLHNGLYMLGFVEYYRNTARHFFVSDP